MSERDTFELDGFDPQQDPISDVFERVATGLTTEQGTQALIEAFRERGDATIPDIAAALSSDCIDIQMTSSRVLATLSNEHPDAVRDAVPELAATVTDEEQIVRNYALLALAAVAREHPDAVRPVVAACGELLPTDIPHVRARVVEVLGAVAAENPGEVTPFLPELVMIATDDRTTAHGDFATTNFASSPGENIPQEVSTRMHKSQKARRGARTRDALTRETACRAVADMTTHDPKGLDDHLSEVFDTIASDSLVGQRTALLDALAAIAEHDPEVVIDGANPIGESLEATEYPKLQRQAAHVLALGADADVDTIWGAVEDRLPQLQRMLGADEPAVRAAAIGLLSYVAEHRPRKVAKAADERLLDCIEDEYEPVRAGAVWCLRFLREEVDGADDALRTAARTDASAEIQQLAAETIGSDPS